MMFFKVAQNETRYLGYFSNNVCHHELSKIAQSGHTGRDFKPQQRILDGYFSHLGICLKRLCCFLKRPKIYQRGRERPT